MAYCPPIKSRRAAPQAVAAELGGRDAQQVKHHFLYVQNQNLRKGPWTQEEDAALLKARFLGFCHAPHNLKRECDGWLVVPCTLPAIMFSISMKCNACLTDAWHRCVCDIEQAYHG